jgi:hypothetical protein
LKEGKQVFNENSKGTFYVVHLNEHEILAFKDGRTPAAHVNDLLSDKWRILDEP